MAASWQLDQERVEDAEALLSHIAGPPAIVSGAELPAWGREAVEWGPQPFPLAVLLFGAALRAGWALCWPQGGLGVLQRPRIRPRSGKGPASYGAGPGGSLAGQQACLAVGPQLGDVCTTYLIYSEERQIFSEVFLSRHVYRHMSEKLRTILECHSQHD